jgi:hypothetical protein
MTFLLFYWSISSDIITSAPFSTPVMKHGRSICLLPLLSEAGRQSFVGIATRHPEKSQGVSVSMQKL